MRVYVAMAHTFCWNCIELAPGKASAPPASCEPSGKARASKRTDRAKLDEKPGHQTAVPKKAINPGIESHPHYNNESPHPKTP